MFIRNENYYTVSDVSEILKLSRNTTYRLVNQPDFPKVRFGRAIRIPQSKFEEFCNHNLYTKYELD